MIRIVLVDDHKVFREGVSALLAQNPDFQVVGTLGEGEALIPLLQEQAVEVVLMDIDLLGKVNGITATQEVLHAYPSVHILAFTMHDERTYVWRMLEAGASGYLLKSAGKEEMFSAIRTVACGDSYFSSEISTLLLRQITKSPAVSLPEDKRAMPLTRRETEVLKLIDEKNHLLAGQQN